MADVCATRAAEEAGLGEAAHDLDTLSGIFNSHKPPRPLQSGPPGERHLQRTTEITSRALGNDIFVTEDQAMGQAQEWMEEAVRQQEAGKLAEAAPLYERILRLDPGHAGALYHLGKLELARANTAAGAELLRQAAAKRPEAAEVHQSLGVAYKLLGEWGNAALAFERALAIDPQHAPSYFELADLSQTLGRIDSAIDFFLRTINLDPSNTEAFRRLGELLYARGNWVGAENCFARVVDAGLLNRDVNALAELMSKLAIALIRQEKLDAAAQVYMRILGLVPGMGEIYANLAFVYERQGRLEEALEAGQRGVELAPAYADGHNNLGVAWRAVHRLDEARRCFQRAVSIRPDFALAQFNLGTIDLMQGDYAAGWRGYEWRNLTLNKPPRKFSVPRWDGQPIPGRTLLVHTEQGYGDTIQFARFLRIASARSAARIILEGPAALLPLLRNVAGVDVVIQTGRELPPVDAEIPLPSLPGALDIGLDDLPGDVPYLTIPASSRATWRDRLTAPRNDDFASEPDSLRVGFVWSGNPAQQLNVIRSCSLSHFAALAQIPDFAWYSLQKEAEGAVLSAEWPAGVPVVALGPMLNDFADTAAAIGELDLIITVDTSMAHLAGALGRPTWTLLSHTPDWRWQLDREDTAWYPTMRLFRQPRWGDWESVFADVAGALRQLSSERERSPR